MGNGGCFCWVRAWGHAHPERVAFLMRRIKPARPFSRLRYGSTVGTTHPVADDGLTRLSSAASKLAIRHCLRSMLPLHSQCPRASLVLELVAWPYIRSHHHHHHHHHRPASTSLFWNGKKNSLILLCTSSSPPEAGPCNVRPPADVSVYLNNWGGSPAPN